MSLEGKARGTVCQHHMSQEAGSHAKRGDPWKFLSPLSNPAACDLGSSVGALVLFRKEVDKPGGKSRVSPPIQKTLDFSRVEGQALCGSQALTPACRLLEDRKQSCLVSWSFLDQGCCVDQVAGTGRGLGAV